MKGYVLDYVNENEFRKLERALKKYNMLAYKKLNFVYYPALRNGEAVGELVSQNKTKHTKSYELKLPSDKTFAQMTDEEREADLDLILREIERSDNEALRAKKDIMAEFVRTRFYDLSDDADIALM